jgi:hypothetical protein
MSRRRKPKHSAPLHADSPASPHADGKMQPPLSREAFKPLFEKALAIAKSKLQATGTIGTTTLFLYAKSPEGSPEDKITHVSVSYKDAFHKEAVRQKIRNKVSAEGAYAVVLLASGPRGREGNCLISGAKPDATAVASITYTLDKETKTFNFSELVWRDEPVRNFFLAEIFSAPATREAE